MEDLKERGLQSYRIEDAFADFNQKNRAKGIRNAFDYFEWQTDDGDPVSVPLKSILHESSGQTYWVMNKTELEKQLTREQVNQKHGDVEMEM